MAQTTKETKNLWVSDGALASIKRPGDGSYTDIGTVKGGFPLTYEYDVLNIESGNGKRLTRRFYNQRIGMELELYDIDYDIVDMLMNGQTTKVETAASPVATIPDQVIAAGWSGDTIYDLEMLTSSSDSTPLYMGSTKPTVTITLDLGGTPEVLTEANGKINLVRSYTSTSGWGIVVNDGILTTGSPTTFAITLEYGLNTPIARTSLHIGSTTGEFENYEMKFEHTDSAGRVRGVAVHSVAPDASGLMFGFLGQDVQEYETYKFKLLGELDESRTDGRKLVELYYDSGAK